MEQLLKTLSDFFINEYVDFEGMFIYISSFGITIYINKKNGISFDALQKLKVFLGNCDIDIVPFKKNKIVIEIYIFNIIF